jgi:hypothetical protein
MSGKEAPVRDLTFEEIKLVSGAGKDGSDPDENSKNGESNNRHRKEERAPKRDTEVLPIG